MKKQMIVMLCFLCMIMSVTAITGKQTVSAASRTQLKQKIEDEADGKVSKMYYDDFDYDGQKEAFAVLKESENEEYSILKIVADNIEGGLQTIQGRLKRYEKDI